MCLSIEFESVCCQSNVLTVSLGPSSTLHMLFHSGYYQSWLHVSKYMCVTAAWLNAFQRKRSLSDCTSPEMRHPSRWLDIPLYFIQSIIKIFAATVWITGIYRTDKQWIDSMKKDMELSRLNKEDKHNQTMWLTPTSQPVQHPRIKII